MIFQLRHWSFCVLSLACGSTRRLRRRGDHVRFILVDDGAFALNSTWIKAQVLALDFYLKEFG